jgi:F420-dependent oxidoreductase-like protein
MTMRFGVFGAAGPGWVDDIVDGARRAEADGFDSFWLGQAFGIDALTALAVAAGATDRIELATGVVPINTRHPQALAAQALTAQGAASGRLTLGVGVSHRHTVEQRWGLRFDPAVRRLREYLEALHQLLAGEESKVDGHVVKSFGALQTGGVTPPSVLVAALGPDMLSLAGSMSDGTVLGETGPKTIADHIVPAVTRAAEAAGRSAPRVVACFPTCVTSDEPGVRARLEERLRAYASYPSFRAMLDREGVATGADIAIVGSEDKVQEMIMALEPAGVTDFVAIEMAFADDDGPRTRAVLTRLAAAAGTGA